MNNTSQASETRATAGQSTSPNLPTPQTHHYDAIVIGSGLGGLTCASLLTQLYGKKVLVLEQHFKLGGFTHAFKRAGGFHWDVGLHYVGQAGPGEDFDRFFRLITGDRVKWKKMADPFERFIYPGLNFKVRSGAENYKRDLIAQFPAEEAALQQYFRDTKRAVQWLAVHGARILVPKFLYWATGVVLGKAKRLAKMSTGEYLSKNFRDPKLRALVASQWGDYGLPPGQSSFLIHSVVVEHYLGGGYYPEGSAETIASGVLQVLTAHGSTALTNHQVTEILLDKGQTVGVRVQKRVGKEFVDLEFRAPLVISNAGVRATYLKLLPNKAKAELPFLEHLRSIPPGFANVTLFLGLSESPAKLGIVGENHWIFDEYDHDSTYRRRNDLARGKPCFAYLSFPSMKDPKATAHTAEIIAPIDLSEFEKWEAGEWKSRGEGYSEFKEKISESLIEFVEKSVPGLKGLICYRELATPLTTKSFTGHFGGEIYGLPATPERLDYDWLSAKSPIPGLFLTGADVAAHGIGGALMGGFMTVAAIEGLRAFPKIFSEAARQTKQAEQQVTLSPGV